MVPKRIHSFVKLKIALLFSTDSAGTHRHILLLGRNGVLMFSSFLSITLQTGISLCFFLITISWSLAIAFWQYLHLLLARSQTLANQKHSIINNKPRASTCYWQFKYIPAQTSCRRSHRFGWKPVGNASCWKWTRVTMDVYDVSIAGRSVGFDVWCNFRHRSWSVKLKYIY